MQVLALQLDRNYENSNPFLSPPQVWPVGPHQDEVRERLPGFFAEICSHAVKQNGPLGKAVVIAVIAWPLLSGCAALPVNQLFPAEDENGLMKQVMERKDRIVHLSSRETDRGKPVLLLLHGATDDPTEMMDIFREFRGKYDVFLYSYNYHDRVERVGSDLVKEITHLRADNRLVEDATVIVFSYSAIVFREAVIGANDRSLFSGMSLVQLVPTAGGSLWARWMTIPVVGPLASLASKPSAAENPYGRFAERLWEGEGNKKFYQAIRPERMYTILLEGDSHSLATVKNKRVQQRYNNGLGINVVVVPKSAPVRHDTFPTDPVGLEYLRKTLQRNVQDRTVNPSLYPLPRAPVEVGAQSPGGSLGQ